MHFFFFTDLFSLYMCLYVTSPLIICYYYFCLSLTVCVLSFLRQPQQIMTDCNFTPKCFLSNICTVMKVLESNLWFSISVKDTLVRRPEQPGIKLPTFQLVDDLVYLLSYSHPKFTAASIPRWSRIKAFSKPAWLPRSDEIVRVLVGRF